MRVLRFAAYVALTMLLSLAFFAALTAVSLHDPAYLQRGTCVAMTLAIGLCALGVSRSTRDE